VELKTLPVDARGQPKESTYVCVVPLEGTRGEWKSSWVYRKLNRVLWIPVEADTAVPLPERRIGSPLLWSPDEEQERILREDWEELMNMVCMGELEQITARHGIALQIRPKAANARSLTWGIDAAGNRVPTTPRESFLFDNMSAMHDSRPLSETEEHAHLTITAITADKPTQCRLMGLGLGVGKEVELLRNRRGDVVLKNGNSRVSLGAGIARHILARLTRCDGDPR